MIAINTEVLSINDNGVRTVRTLIIGKTMPQTLPTSGNGIDGLLSTDLFAPGSAIFCPDDNSKAVANEDGEFKVLG